MILAFVVALSLLKHLSVSKSSSSIFSLVSISLWLVNAFMRLSRIVYRNFGGWPHHYKSGQGTITHFVRGTGQDDVTALRMIVHMHRPIQVRPGQYFYLFLSDMGVRQRFQSHPYVVSWWDFPMAARTLSFLIQPQTGISADLISRKSISRVIIDGPYGKDLELESYETVILIARGIGIAGIMPHIRHMTDRRMLPNENWATKYRRGLITRKIDVYWVLDDDYQDEWVADWMKQLYDLDSKNVGLFDCCGDARISNKHT